jgi:Skp family chaperone for outer membrane proteins
MIAATFVFAAIFTVSAFGQAPAPTKIGWIITAAFGDEKEGITKYIAAAKALDTEMKTSITELQNMQARMKVISDDLAKMNSNPAVPIDQKAAAAKSEEGQGLQRQYEFKQKEAQARYEKRRDEVLGPITATIYQAMQEYAKQKGYAVILDISTLGQPDAPSPILVLDQSANITKDFITFYNARPATTATTAVPK